jgi:hypothetical protein
MDEISSFSVRHCLFCAHSPYNDFLLVIYLPLQVALCIWFLYDILGWSAFVGMAAMIALFPIPGVIASKIQKVQKESMKQASIVLSRFFMLAMTFVADGCTCTDCY